LLRSVQAALELDKDVRFGLSVVIYEGVGVDRFALNLAALGSGCAGIG